ncbi:MAG: hypothetical protein M1823_006226 [Watsoniomyces obsoletus]|nr:MAG: hypothetical protein M1823_006226 [Watsoniomyces obsoletus]
MDPSEPAADQPAPPASSSSSSSTKSSSELAWRALRGQHPQKTVDGFWKKFVTKNPGKVFRVLPEDLYAQRAAANVPKGRVAAHKAATSLDEATASCQAKVAKIVRECRRLNQKYTDPHFDIETDLKWGDRDCLNGLVRGNYVDRSPMSVKRVPEIFEEPRFYIDGASYSDVRQGRDGDCWFMSALSTLSNDGKLIERVCVARDEAVGVYGFIFHRDGEWISSIVDDNLYLTKPDYDESVVVRRQWDDRDRVNAEEEYQKTFQTGSGALYFAKCSDPNETWVPLLEKAYAKAHGDYTAISGGDGGEALEDLTGGVSSEIFTSSILDRELFWNQELMNVNRQVLFSCFTGIFGGSGERRGIQEMHDYSILRAVEEEGERLLLLRNPWGRVEWTGPWSDGSKEWTPFWLERLGHRFGNDGTFWISYKDLLRKYQCLTRTRLFGSEWSVTQKWTSLNVPWSVDYHDTKFAFELTQPGPVVIVLSQLDERYFIGLEGQYHFNLHFRLHKEGEDDYIVRSGRTYTVRRSVSTEVELEPGRYSVLINIDAERNPTRSLPEDVVRDRCRGKRSKLLQIGLSYDLAHAKGQVVETEAEKKQRRRARAAKKRAELRKQKEAFLEQRERERRKREEKKARKAAKKTQQWVEVQVRVNGNEKTTRDGPHGHHGSEKHGAHQQQQEEPQNEARPKAESPAPTPAKKPDRLRWQSGQQQRMTQKQPYGDESTKKVHPSGHVATHAGPEEQHEGEWEDESDANEDEDGDEHGSEHDEPRHDHNDDEGDEGEEGHDQDEHADEPKETNNDEDADEDDDDDSSIMTPTVATTISEESELHPAAEYVDEFARSPWNAVCVVGLRVYSKDQGVSIEVVRPRETDTETALDPDDTAADAARDGRDLNAVEKAEAEEQNEQEQKQEQEQEQQVQSMNELTEEVNAMGIE